MPNHNSVISTHLNVQRDKPLHTESAVAIGDSGEKKLPLNRQKPGAEADSVTSAKNAWEGRGGEEGREEMRQGRDGDRKKKERGGERQGDGQTEERWSTREKVSLEQNRKSA